MTPLLYCFWISDTSFCALSNFWAFSAGMVISRMEIEMPARVANSKPMSFSRSAKMTVDHLRRPHFVFVLLHHFPRAGDRHPHRNACMQIDLPVVIRDPYFRG